MKYSITGHTNGIGGKLFETLSPNAIGFSKTSGFDIKLKKDRLKIVLASKDCDVFVNNAQDDFGQLYMLLDIFEAWRYDQTKVIINIGSQIIDTPLVPQKQLYSYYFAQKFCLKQMVEELQKVSKCRLIYKSFSWVGTKKILERYPNLEKSKYITEDQAVKEILNFSSEG